jgi:putative FmdB family regulatory protein
VPTYQYACTVCGHQLEAVQSFSDAPLTVCPECDGRLRKVFSSVGIVFKGSGFYRTDSRAGTPAEGASSGAKSEAAPAKSEAGSSSAPSSGTSSSSGASSSSGSSSSSGAASSSGTSSSSTGSSSGGGSAKAAAVSS